MNLKEYEEKLFELDKTHTKERNELALEFAKSHQKYQIGDFVKDKYSNFIIKIDKINLYYDFVDSMPNLSYSGEVYTKKKNKIKKKFKRNNLFG